MIYSPPNEAARSANANVLNDELLPGLNYNNTDSGIFFNEFPYDIPGIASRYNPSTSRMEDYPWRRSSSRAA